MIAPLILMLIVMLGCVAAGFCLCMVLVMRRWIKEPKAPAMMVNMQIDDALMIDWMRSRGYRVEIEKRLVN